MSEKKHQPLSASRIKTLFECSWKYWCAYKLKLPKSDNEGSLRGSICHTVFECLGRERHYGKFIQIVDEGEIWGCKPVTRLVKSFCEKNNIDDEENLELVNRMILEGLNYDFFAKLAAGRHKISESHDELNFDITVSEEDKSYRFLGFIDKLFIFKGKKLALIRDYKTSKNVFTKGEISDNVQDLMYRLAVKKLYPKIENHEMEFIFVKFPCGNEQKGVVKTNNVTEEELEGFEYFLSEIQEEVDNFDEESAQSNFALDKGYPDKDEGFCGKLLCGYAKYPGHIKPATGKPYWHCEFKFPMDYYEVTNKKGEKLRGIKVDDKEAIKKAKEKGFSLKKKHYPGCPRHCSSDNDVLL